MKIAQDKKIPSQKYVEIAVTTQELECLAKEIPPDTFDGMTPGQMRHLGVYALFFASYAEDSMKARENAKKRIVVMSKEEH